MARKSDKKETALQEIREAVKTHGETVGLKLMRERYSDIPRSTWKRWMDELCLSPMEVAKREAKGAAAHLPAAPAPAYIAENPVEARRNIDFMSRLESLYEEAEMLRDYSVAKGQDADGNTVKKIKIPTYFAQSIKLRSDLLEGAVRTIQQVYDLQRMQRFYDSVLEEIAAESPEVALRITERLARLNGELGMTIDARI